MSELQAPPQRTTIDMSLNRIQPPPTTTTTTSPDNNAANTEHTDLDTLPAEEGGIANEDPKPRSAGSAKSTQSSHHSQVVEDSKPEGTQEGETQQGSGEKEGEENNSVIQPESTVKDEGVADSGEERTNGEATNPPEEEIVEEEEVTETKEEEEERPPSHEAEEASKLEVTNDTTVEEVPEEQLLEKEEMDPPTVAGDGGEPEPEEVEPQPNKEGSHEEEQDATTEPLDTSVPEEIVVRFHAVTLIHIQFLFAALIFYNLLSAGGGG